MFIFVVIAAKKRREKLSAGSTGLLEKDLDLKGMDVRISAFVYCRVVVALTRQSESDTKLILFCLFNYASSKLSFMVHKRQSYIVDKRKNNFYIIFVI